VAAIAAGLAAVSVPWELSTGTAPAERSYHLLLATDRYDAWLIYWPPGTGLDTHDHGGSEGAFSVVAGVLHEEVPASDPRSPGASRQVEPGQTVHFDADHVHSVVNRGPAGATSVHVYSPPLRSMGFYAADADGRLVVERVDDVGRARR
jgi:predicted metal-dependent enzyme (double-stranded beta helix superfamily)